MLIPDEDLHRVDAAKVDIDEVQRKIQEAARKKEEKIQKMKQMQEEKELEGCTFAPQLVNKKNKKTVAEDKRDLSKFLEDQKKYEELKLQKQNERKEKFLQSEVSTINMAPMINEKSKKILEKKKKMQEEGKAEEESEPKSKLASATSMTREEANKSKQSRPQTAAAMKKRMASPQPNETFKP